MWMWDLLVDVCVWCLLFVVGAAVLVLIMMMWFGWNGNTFYVEEREREREKVSHVKWFCLHETWWMVWRERTCIIIQCIVHTWNEIRYGYVHGRHCFLLVFWYIYNNNIIIFLVYMHKYRFSYWNKIPVFILWKGDGSKRYTHRYPVKLLQRAEFYDLGGLNLHALLSAFSPSLFGFHNNNGQERERREIDYDKNKIVDNMAYREEKMEW